MSEVRGPRSDVGGTGEGWKRDGADKVGEGSSRIQKSLRLGLQIPIPCLQNPDL
jgi:hypothetical protein